MRSEALMHDEFLPWPIEPTGRADIQAPAILWTIEANTTAK